MSSPTIVDGAGALRVAGGTMSVASGILVSNFKLESGTLNGVGSITVTGTLDWTGGTFAEAGTTTIASTGTFNITWAQHQVTIARTINNAGTAVWSGTGGPWWRPMARFFDNKDTGTMSIQNDQSWSNNGGAASTFMNHGILSKTAGTATTTFASTSATSALSRANTGGLTFGANLYNTGAFNIGSGTSHHFRSRQLSHKTQVAA